MSFGNLKKNRGSFQDLQKKLADEKKGGGYSNDDRYWEFKVDDAGNGFAVIRFLPAPAGEEVPYVKLYSHGFKDERTGKWYIENSRTTLGEPDPVSEANTELWNSGLESDKAIARQRKRRQNYIANILVIDDPKNPQNNGKVFLWKFGPRLFQKIEGAMNPEFQDEVAFNPFDFWEGADFKIKARKLDGQRSYDKSEFTDPSELFDGDDTALEALYNKLYSLQAEIAPDKFKPYDQLKTRFQAVIGAKNPAPREGERQERELDREFQEPERETPRARREETPARREDPAPSRGGDDGEDSLAKYAGLLED
ncbi:ssDNA binding protein [Stenotrophomonas phage Mendera]|uniref:Single-stranded DNA-binding protein n=4 Tax=Menderavirus TaxID=2843421 RepID=A0A0H4J2T2_9CAUD|nr:single strand DNA binding protein [Stenotrophomonas phage YB07]YP_009851123.1 single strand DNA binding protein [Stenotrophomonas phage Mendera]YP_010077906.1 single strand DNA binding protein [Stenotrophomonas phage IME-SM1]YP_010667643.1 single-stranded DNA-binding protein [Stenotrophomonas maltophilia phage vB_SmaM_Ps15]QXN67439.1 single stranded DNA-binding protein [Stenotrophomonas phage BUCT608]QYW02614.1 ssDNA-binding protein [Stenotrophomonas phage Marzo]AKO61713.1 single stranded 